MKKLRVGVLFGGRSGEHEISLRSAASILRAIDKRRYAVVLIGITKKGRWLLGSEALRLLQGEYEETSGVTATTNRHYAGLEVVLRQVIKMDIVFPVLHGTFGEDGTVQGLLELTDIPYVGTGVLGSAVSMDKDVMKRLFRCAGLPLVKHVVIDRSRWNEDPKEVGKQIAQSLKYPVFVKPARLGSSVGVSKAHDETEFAPGMEEAAKYDSKIIVEEAVSGKEGKAREIECAILGNKYPFASIPGEIVPTREFYDYEAKYLDGGAELRIPAKMTRAQQKKIQRLAVEAFRAVECAGLARVDFLMNPGTGKIFVNEINTMPGFTSMSMYPKLWEESGIPFAMLIDALIRLGLEQRMARRRKRYSYSRRLVSTNHEGALYRPGGSSLGSESQESVNAEKPIPQTAIMERWVDFICRKCGCTFDEIVEINAVRVLKIPICPSCNSKEHVEYWWERLF